MKKRLLVLLLSVLTLVAFAGCGSEPKPLTEEEKKALLSESFSSAPFFEGKESATLLTNDEVKAVISAAPSDKYEVYPGTHNLPDAATLYKGGDTIAIDLNDPRLIRLINFFNNCVYYSKCSYTQGLYSKDYLDENILNDNFRIELKYTESSITPPTPYGNCTTGCDLIVIENSDHAFTLIAHNIGGYEGDANYPFAAVGFVPMHNSYPWLELFGF
jgi:hypothetical protein